MTATYKLTYFDFSGSSEPIRFLFHYGDIKFENIRLSEEKWPEYKKKMPFGQMPILEYNGKIVNQSLAIARYVAKLVKLNGKNDWEDLEIDGIVNTVRDLHIKIAAYYYQKDENLQEIMKHNLFSETIPYFMERFSEITGKNNGYLAAQRLTWADIVFVATLDNINGMAGTDIIANYPKLITLRNKIYAIPNIKTYLETRPKTKR